MAKKIENTRKLILDTAFELFATQGYHATSMSQIAQKAGVSKGLAYNYFTGKDNLLGEILEQTFLDSMASWDRLMGKLSTIPDPAEKIRHMIDYYIDHLLANQNFYRLYLSLLLQPHVLTNLNSVLIKLKPRTDRIQEESFALFRNTGSKDPEAETWLIKSMINGIMLSYITAGDILPLERVRKLLKEKCETGIPEG
jgi:AcrR family transcriptional regulator